MTTNDFEPLAPQVYAWAYRLLGRHHDALDVVQDVFIRWERQCTQSPPDKPMGWLRQVTVNRAIDVRRRCDTAGAQVETTFTDTGAQAGDFAAEDLDALRIDITTALVDLTDLQRGVLVAKVYDDKTFAEIADEMDVSIPTAKTHYLRAIRAVRDRLGPRWGREMNP